MKIKDSQCFRVLSYMNKNGSITTMEAFSKLNITRLSGRIHELRRHGFDIESTNVVTEDGKRYVRYSLNRKYRILQFLHNRKVVEAGKI